MVIKIGNKQNANRKQTTAGALRISLWNLSEAESWKETGESTLYRICKYYRSLIFHSNGSA